MPNVFTIDGETYDAINVGGDAWIVHWFKKDGTTVETLLSVSNATAEYVTRLAIKRGSWA
jgi:hypothetical protein